jgi:hypothetical protein
LIYIALDDYLVVADKDRDSPPTFASSLPQEGVWFSKYTNLRGDKSAKRPQDALLALLALSHIWHLVVRSASESVKPILVEDQRP